MKRGGARSAKGKSIRGWLLLVGALCLVAAAWPPASLAAEADADPMAPPQAFAANCVRCHAEDAQGDGPDHTQFIPSPANLPLTRDTEGMYRSIIRGGVPGTAMPAFPLSKGDYAQLISYIKERPFRTDRQWGNPWTMAEENVSLETGQKIYLTACSGCHGTSGAGDGPWASDPHVWPKPTNFRARNSDPGRLYYIIGQGSEGTMMAPQADKFPEMARWTMAKYCESLFDPSSTATMRTPPGRPEHYSNPVSMSDEKALALGQEKYALYCSPCHGDKGRGSFLAPKLVDREWMYGGGTDNAVYTVVDKGIPGKLMVSFAALPEHDRWSVITFIRHRGGLPEPILEVGRGGGKSATQAGGKP